MSKARAGLCEDTLMRFGGWMALAALAWLCLVPPAGAHTFGCSPDGRLCVVEDGDPGGTVHAFNYTIGGPLPPPITASVFATSGPPIPFTATIANIFPSDVNWLTVSPNSGTAPVTPLSTSVTISINPAFLSPRDNYYYVATIRFASPVLGTALDVFIGIAIFGSATLIASPNTLTVAYNAGAQNPGPQTCSILTLGTSTWALRYNATVSVSGSVNWLSVTPLKGQSPARMTISINPVGLGVGSHTGVIELSDTAGTFVPPNLITIRLTVLPVLTSSQSSLTFSLVKGGAPPPSQNVTIGSAGGSTLVAVIPSSTGNWLTVSPTSGSTSFPLAVAIDAARAAALAAGPHTGEIIINSPLAVNSLSIRVTLTVSSPALTLSRNMLTIRYRQGESPPPPEVIAVGAPSPGAAFTVTVAGNVPWIQIQRSQTTIPANVTIVVDPTGLGIGQQVATIVFAAAGGQETLTVTLIISPASSLQTDISTLTFAAAPGASPPARIIAVTSLAQQVEFTATAASTGGWLSVTPVRGTTPASVTVQVNSSPLAASGYTGALTLQVSGEGPLVLAVNLAVGTIPEVLAVVNAASSLAGPQARGALVTLYGRRLSSTTAENSVLPLPANLAGTSVIVENAAGRPVYVSPDQANLQLPFETPLGRAQLVVVVNGVRSLPVTVEIAPAAPGIFGVPGSNRAVAQNQDFSLNRPENPVPQGGVLIAYLTGQGDLEPGLGTGQPAPRTPLSIPRLPVRATIAGRAVRVQFAGMAPDFVGLLQANLIVEGIPAGDQPLVVFIGERPSNSLLVSVGR